VRNVIDRLDVLGDPDLRRTVLFVRAQPGSVTADEVAAHLGVPRTVARWRLERLAEAEFLTTGFERRNGRSGPGAGRPAKTYAAAVETTAVEFPRRRYELLLRLLVDALPQRRRSRQLAEVGTRFASELARAARLRRAKTLPAALDSVCRALGRLGFQARVESVAEREAVIVSATCPLRPLVVTDPETRALDQGMWRGLLAAAAGEQVVQDARCLTVGCLDGSAPCRIVVSFAGRHS
jgi:predicted ArsR family transcriptional regulator